MKAPHVVFTGGWVRGPVGLGALLAVMLLAACDGTEADGGGAGDGGGACETSNLIAQCPAGTSPLLGSQAESSCAAVAGGVVLDGTGQASGQCYGVGSCRVVCQFAMPCRCGVESVGRDGVICAACEGAASCGNGVCEGGESPATCGIDCGVLCMPDERRCDGEALQACSLQGRWDTLECPSGEVCMVAEGMPRCARDPGIIIGGDAGVAGDDGVRPEDGRLILGDGTWPVIEAHPTPAFPRAVVARPLAPEGLAMFGIQAGGLERFRLVDAGDTLEGAGRYGSLRWTPAGAPMLLTEPEYPAADEATFCAAWVMCRRDYTLERCAAEIYGALGGDPVLVWQRNCIAAEAAADCRVATGGQVGTCLAQPVRVHADGAQIRIADSRLLGGMLVGPTPDGTQMVAIDLDARTAYHHDPIGEYLILNRHLTLSADGRKALAWGEIPGTSDTALLLWDWAQGPPRAILPRSSGTYHGVALSPDGQVLAVALSGTGEAALDAGVSLWNVAEQRRIVTLRGTLGRTALAFSPDGLDLLVDADDSTSEVWRLGAEPVKQQALDFDGRPAQVAYAPDGGTLAVQVQNLLSLWDTRTGQRWWSQAVGGAVSLSFASDGRRLVVGSALVLQAP